jgi:hypothetical protein
MHATEVGGYVADALARASAISGLRSCGRCGPSRPSTPSDHGEVVPFSSSFFAGRLLNCLHHDVRSRLADAGSGVMTTAGWGSPLRTRGVCELLCMAGFGMAGALTSVAALRRGAFAG